MGEWVLLVEGTEFGRSIAMCLALVAAVLHAAFAAMQKGIVNPWIMRGAIDISYGIIALPIALIAVPWPEPHMWLIFAVTWGIHTAYKVLQAMAYMRGAYTVVYPVVRGSGSLFTIIAAFLFFGEVFPSLDRLYFLVQGPKHFAFLEIRSHPLPVFSAPY